MELDSYNQKGNTKQCCCHLEVILVPFLKLVFKDLLHLGIVWAPLFDLVMIMVALELMLPPLRSLTLLPLCIYICL